MKPFVVCQPLSKFGMLTFVVSHTMGFIPFFPRNRGVNKIFGSLVLEQKREGKFSMVGKGRNEEVLINKRFGSTYKDEVNKTRKAMTSIAVTVKLCASKHSIDTSQRQRKK